MYYSEIFIDPSNPNLVYTPATTSMKSEDGGRTWSLINAQPTYDVGVHSDMHAMWINPGDPEHFYLAGDAGLHETYDGGQNYRKLNNFNIAQFYAIGVDMRDPYWIYGGLQDNHSFMGPSETRHWEGIINDDWRQSGFGDEERRRRADVESDQRAAHVRRGCALRHARYVDQPGRPGTFLPGR